MSIRILRLAVTGSNKPTADLNFSSGSNLIYGPSDTGKSYIVGCIKYALGSDTIPKQIPFAEGYERLALQFYIEEKENYTVFRSLSGGESIFYEGTHDIPPAGMQTLKTRDVNEFLIKNLGIENIKILTSGEKKGNLTAGDLRHFSIFTEGETLSEHAVLGPDTNIKTRRKSAFYLMMTGIDDSAVILGPDKKERFTTQGQLLAFEESIKSLRAELPKDFAVEEVNSAVAKIDEQIRAHQSLLSEHSIELNELRSKLSQIERKLVYLENLNVAYVEKLERFRLLDKKYQNDLERLQFIRTAASVFDEFATQPCALCNTPLMQQTKSAKGHLPKAEQLAIAADAEYKKIDGLRVGLRSAITDVEKKIFSIKVSLENLLSKQNQLAFRHSEILALLNAPKPNELLLLIKRRSEYILQLNSYERLEAVIANRDRIVPLTKKKTINVERNATEKLPTMISRISELLEAWGLPESKQVSFDELLCDIRLTERPRTSFGKGKRAIFLAAYAIALMECAVNAGTPHLGVVVIDSPVLTYRDPKCTSSDDAISDTVAERFFNWMAKWHGPGQLIVLENEDPQPGTLEQIPHTTFVGPNVSGRRGFYP